MVADNPDPFPRLAQTRQHLKVGHRHPVARGPIVKAVAKTNHRSRLEPPDQRSETLQRAAAVIGRQERAFGAEGRPLLEMQIGDDEHTAGGPVEGAAGARHEVFVAEGKIERLFHGLPVASAIRSAAASPSS